MIEDDDGDYVEDESSSRCAQRCALWNAFALVSVAFSAWSVMATKYCHNWDGTCDVEWIRERDL